MNSAATLPIPFPAPARRLRSGRAWLLPALAAAVALAGCGAGSTRTMQPVSAALSLSGGGASIDTNCTGCNAANSRGGAVYRFSALQEDGSRAEVTWTVAGGDARAGAGTIDSEGRYTPPDYLTADRAEVMVTAHAVGNPALTAQTAITVTPGFLEPLTPENVTLGPGGTITLTGKLSEAGGNTGIRFALASSADGAEGGAGVLSPAECEHAQKAFTSCTVTYYAPAVVDAPTVSYVVAHAGKAKTEMAILLNPAGVASNPVTHREALNMPMPLGGSGGNNGDLDARGETVTDCCGGTLGALIADNTGRQYLLSNNHVLARSDHGVAGDAIVQPGLIDNNCTPNGDGPGTTPVATLASWLPLKSPQTNADAAIAQVSSSRVVDAGGAILELGTRRPDGTLTSGAPGVTSTNGKGETAHLSMQVAKSGRTTGLTCGAVSAVDVDIAVDYFEDCAETRHYLTKVFTHQLALSGDRFSDAGDSGALVVDAANAEPVGLFFAGGVDASGVVEGVATPAPEVLSELGALAGSGTSYSFAGGADHAVSCLSFGNSTVAAAQREPVGTVETARAQQALFLARALVNPREGILGVASGKSSDRTGEAAVLVYVDEAMTPNVPVTIGGVRTVVIPTTARALAAGNVAQVNDAVGLTLPAAAISRAVEVKEQAARSLMEKDSAIFGVGVGQSLDNPREAALVLYVDKNRMPSQLPQAIDGLRTRFVIMDRMHVTRSYSTAASARRCVPPAATEPAP